MSQVILAEGKMDMKKSAWCAAVPGALFSLVFWKTSSVDVK